MTYTVKPSKLDEHGNPITRPVPPHVNRAINDWMTENHDHDSLVALLARFGLHPYDLAEPRFELVVTDDEDRTKFARTGDHHGFDDAAAREPDNQFAFKVSGPYMDWAEKALQDAQDRYFAANPDARRYARALIWRIEKIDTEAGK